MVMPQRPMETDMKLLQWNIRDQVVLLIMTKHAFNVDC